MTYDDCENEAAFAPSVPLTDPGIQIKILPLHPDFERLGLMPRRMTAGAAGYDLSAAEDVNLLIGGNCAVRCGFAAEIPEGYEAQIRPRSGLAAKHGVTVLNAPGTIDSDYRGEVVVILVNHGYNRVRLPAGARIAQLLFARVEPSTLVLADALSSTARGAGGGGSTGT